MEKFIANNNTIWKVSSKDAHVYWLQSINTGKLVSVSSDKVVLDDKIKLKKLKVSGRITIPLDEKISILK